MIVEDISPVLDLANRDSQNPVETAQNSSHEHSHPTSSPSTPPTPSQNSQYTTPLHRLGYPTSSVSDEVRQKLTEVSPNGKSCLITWMSGGLECAHLLPRATQGHVLEKLEQAWGMSERSLHIDTTRNLLWLNAATHSTFDNAEWALVPSTDLLNSIERTALDQQFNLNRPKFTHLYPHENREYSFAQLVPTTDPYPRKIISNDGTQVSLESHLPPFATLSPLISHVHPYFVICNVAAKDERHRPRPYYLDASGEYQTLAHDVGLFHRIEKCRRIYHYWMTSVQPLKVSTGKSRTSRVARSAASSHSTTSRRSNRINKRKRMEEDDNVAGTGDPFRPNPAASNAQSDSISTPPGCEDGEIKLDIYISSETMHHRVKVAGWLHDLPNAERPPTDIGVEVPQLHESVGDSKVRNVKQRLH